MGRVSCLSGSVELTGHRSAHRTNSSCGEPGGYKKSRLTSNTNTKTDADCDANTYTYTDAKAWTNTEAAP